MKNTDFKKVLCVMIPIMMVMIALPLVPTVNASSKTVEIRVEEEEQAQILSVKGGFRIKATIQTGDNPADCSITMQEYDLVLDLAHAEVPAHTTETIKTKFVCVLGFTTVNITVKANAVTEKYTAFVLGPLFFNLQEV